MGNYVYRHGEAWLSTRTVGGEPSNFNIALPEIDTLSVSLTTEKITHISKRSSVASKDVSVPYMVDGSGQMVVSEHAANILKLGLFGNTAAVAGGAFTDVAFPTVTLNDVVPIPGHRTHVTSIVVKDSAGTPATLTLNTHYEIVSASAGLIKFINIASFTQPFTISGTEAAGTGIGIFTQRVFELWLRFKGINVVDNDKIEVIDLYKVQFSPTSEWQLMGEGTEVSNVTLDFDLLKDATKAVDATFGQYGRVRQ